MKALDANGVDLGPVYAMQYGAQIYSGISTALVRSKTAVVTLLERPGGAGAAAYLVARNMLGEYVQCEMGQYPDDIFFSQMSCTGTAYVYAATAPPGGMACFYPYVNLGLVASSLPAKPTSYASYYRNGSCINMGAFTYGGDLVELLRLGEWASRPGPLRLIPQ